MSWRKLRVGTDDWLWQCGLTYVSIKAPSGKTSVVRKASITKLAGDRPVVQRFTMESGAEDQYEVHVIKPGNVSRYIMTNRERLMEPGIHEDGNGNRS